MLHLGHSLKPGDFVELLEGIFELNEELVPVLPVELGDYPTPDPTWDYATLWDWLHQMFAHLKSLKEQMAEVEDSTPQTDAALHRKFEVIQALCLKAIEKVRPNSHLARAIAQIKTHECFHTHREFFVLCNAK